MCLREEKKKKVIQRAERGQSHANMWLDNRLVCPCPALDQHRLSFVFIKKNLFTFLNVGISYLCMEVQKASDWSGTTGAQGPGSVVLAAEVV